MKKLSIVVLILVMAAIFSGCTGKSEPKFQQDDIVRIDDFYFRVDRYYDSSDTYAYTGVNSGRAYSMKRERFEAKAVLVEVTPVEVPIEPEDIESLFP